MSLNDRWNDYIATLRKIVEPAGEGRVRVSVIDPATGTHYAVEGAAAAEWTWVAACYQHHRTDFMRRVQAQLVLTGSAVQ